MFKTTRKPVRQEQVNFTKTEDPMNPVLLR